MLQGIGGGIFPLAIGIIRDEFPREKVPGSIGLISAHLRHRRRLGLIAGGLLADHLSYHWIFWLSAISPGSRRSRPRCSCRSRRSAPRAASTCAARRCSPPASFLPLVAISRANDWGWGSARTLGLIALGVVILAGFVALERRTTQPLADIDALKQPPVLMTNIATLLVGFGMFGSFILIPQLAEAPEASGYGFGLDATGAGLLLLPGSLMMLVAGPLSGALGARFGSKFPLAIGCGARRRRAVAAERGAQQRGRRSPGRR